MKASTMGRAAALLFTVAVLATNAIAQTVPPAARSELAPTGKLRVALLVQNPVFVSKDGSAGEMQGVAVDLGRELAKQLGVAFEPVRYASVAKLVDGAKTGDWDVAFLGFDQERAALMDFTSPYAELGSTYLVPAGSKIQAIGNIDKAGVRVGVAERSVQDRVLTQSLKQVQLVRFSGGVTQGGHQLVSTGKVDALAGNRVALMEVAAKLPGSRVLEGQFDAVRHTLAVARGRPAGAAYAKEFIERAKASGLVRQAIDRAQLKGVKVAAASSSK